MDKLLGRKGISVRSQGISVRGRGISVRSRGISVRDMLSRGNDTFSMGAAIRVRELFRRFNFSRMFKEDTIVGLLRLGNSNTSGLLSGLIRTRVVRPMSNCKGKGCGFGEWSERYGKTSFGEGALLGRVYFLGGYTEVGE